MNIDLKLKNVLRTQLDFLNIELLHDAAEKIVELPQTQLQIFFYSEDQQDKVAISSNFL